MSREPLKPLPLAVQLIGKPQRWITYTTTAPLPGEVVKLAPIGHLTALTDTAEDITAALDDWAVVDSYEFYEPKAKYPSVSVGLVRLTANVQRRSAAIVRAELAR